MDNKKQEKDLSSVDFDIDEYNNDYKYLVQKLKSISKSIHLLEKTFLDKET